MDSLKCRSILLAILCILTEKVTGDIQPAATASIVEHTEQPHHAHHANAKQLELVTRLSRNMSYMLPHRYLKRAYAYPGERERARLALQKLLTGQKFKVVLLGGSITLGSGGVDAPPYALRVESWLKENFPNAEVHMGAVGGTQSSYMALCIRVHCPLDADMVILEYAVNDSDHPMPLFKNAERSGMERLIRKLHEKGQPPPNN